MCIRDRDTFTGNMWALTGTGYPIEPAMRRANNVIGHWWVLRVGTTVMGEMFNALEFSGSGSGEVEGSLVFGSGLSDTIQVRQYRDRSFALHRTGNHPPANTTVTIYEAVI